MKVKFMNKSVSRIMSAMLSTGLICLAPYASANSNQNVQALSGQLDKCGTAPMDVSIATCESALADIIEIQQGLEFVDELMVSYYVEAIIRNDLVTQYFNAKNIGKHCEHAEKAWSTAHYASTYAEHPLYAEIKTTVAPVKPAVQTCRSIAGKPEWGAPL